MCDLRPERSEVRGKGSHLTLYGIGSMTRSGLNIAIKSIPMVQEGQKAIVIEKMFYEHKNTLFSFALLCLDSILLIVRIITNSQYDDNNNVTSTTTTILYTIIIIHNGNISNHNPILLHVGPYRQHQM